jgi:putative glycosyltransferase (TIGR04348 family)
VTVEESWSGGACDLLIALHARKSAASVRRFHRERPDAPVVVGVAGTDLYLDLARSKAARDALDAATRIVVLQPAAVGALPREVRAKARVIRQSAPRPARRLRRSRAGFVACVLGHLRPVKDPFRPALAVRGLPASSRVAVFHAGAALSQSASRRAAAESRSNPRWTWLGELSADAARDLLASSHALVLPSRAEGGANVVSEALAAGTPVLASRIPGNVGLLGPDYPGYFRVGDASSLRRLLLRAETDPRCYARLRRACAARAWIASPALERRAWAALLREVARSRARS